MIMAWINETSFTLFCDGRSLLFNCNTGRFIVEIKKEGDKLSVFVFTNGVRMTFDGTRLFDMHNLKVTKGEEGKDELRSILKNASTDLDDGISSVGSYYGVPTKLVNKLINEFLERCDVDPAKYLGFNISKIKISYGKEFSKDSATFESKNFAEVLIESEGCLKAKVYFGAGSPSFMVGDDCENFTENREEFREKIAKINVLLEEYRDVIESLKKWLDE